MHQRLALTVIGAGLFFSLGLTIYGSALAAEPQSSRGREAQQSDIVIGGVEPGATPFVASVEFSGRSIRDLVSITFNIAPKPNSVSKPVNVTWDRDALADHGYLKSDSVHLPVFGLYDGYQNQVTFQLRFRDNSLQRLEYPIATDPYTGSLASYYKNPTILKARAAGTKLGYNFLLLKSVYGSPVITDTDGELRWLASSKLVSPTIYFTNGQFFVGSATSSSITNLQFDGTQSVLPITLPQPLMESFTHNIDPGPSPNNFLAEFNGVDDIGNSVGDIVAVISAYSKKPVLETFDLADILTSYMRKNGDDPTEFVRPGVDWFHVNSSTYDPSDDSVIVSSRENFLIKIRRKTKEIVWILGNPAGYWYTFPSLRAKAITLDPGGDYPIGQHAVSIISNGNIMVFNDGEGSANQPTDNGISRTYSEVSVYSVNSRKMTAHQVWNFDYEKSIFTRYCGSVYETGHSYLVDFANELSNQNLSLRLVGLDSSRNVVFDFRYSQLASCDGAWNAIPINLDDMEIGSGDLSIWGQDAREPLP